MDGYEEKCRLCEYNYQPYDCEPRCNLMCANHEYFKPITNYGIIMKMDEENLAKQFLHWFIHGNSVSWQDINKVYDDILVWLNSATLAEHESIIDALSTKISNKSIPVYNECVSAGYACRGMTRYELSNNLGMCAKWECGNGYMDYNLGCDVPTYRCSNCKCEEELTTDYCPNCGAKMDLGDELL